MKIWSAIWQAMAPANNCAFWDRVARGKPDIACQSSRTVWMMLLVIWLVLGSPVKTSELDLIFLMGPFLLEILHHSTEKHEHQKMLSIWRAVLQSFTPMWCCALPSLWSQTLVQYSPKAEALSLESNWEQSGERSVYRYMSFYSTQTLGMSMRISMVPISLFLQGIFLP